MNGTPMKVEFIRSNPVEAGGSIYFLDALRGFAAWLVVWDHLVCVYPERHGVQLPLVQAVNAAINKPIGLIQNFGWFGVCLFFLISGFIITHVSQRERPAEFAIKRLFRIFPLLWLAVALALLVDESSRTTSGDIVANLLLINYWQHPQAILVGVAWTLAIEVLFYGWVLLTYQLQSRPALQVGLLLTVVAGVIGVARNFGDSFFRFAASFAYLPYLATGQIIYFLAYRRAFGLLVGLGLLATTYAVLLYGLRTIHVQFLPPENSYLTSFVAALAVFLFAWQVNDQLKPGRIMRWLSETSYSIYLFHALVGFFLLDRLAPSVGLTAALFITIPAVIMFVTIIHHLLEKPAQKLGRSLGAVHIC